jgi:hypothetical protein
MANATGSPCDSEYERLVKMNLHQVAVLIAAAIPLCAQEADENQRLLATTVSVVVANAPLGEVITTMRSEYHVPLSFIDPAASAAEPKRVTLDLRNVTLAVALGAIEAHCPGLRHEWINGRLVLLPSDTKYGLRIKTDIKDVGRLDAFQVFVRDLAKRYPNEFGNLLGPSILGSLRAPLYADEVSTKGDRTVLEHLVDLLGNDPRAVFSILRTKGGPPECDLDLVR